MEKKTAKRIITLTVCFLILIAAGVMSFTVKGYSASAGRGRGQAVSTLPSFSELLKGASDGASLTGSRPQESLENLTLNACFSQYKTEGLLGEEATSVICDAVIYLTVDEILCDIDLNFSKAGSDFYAVMQTYCSAQGVFLRFEKVFGADLGKLILFPDALLGRWLDLSVVDLSDILSALSFADRKHLNALSIVSETLARENAFSAANRTGNKFALTSQAFLDFGAVLTESEGFSSDFAIDYKGEFKADLSSKKHPRISYFLNAGQIIVDETSSFVLSNLHFTQSAEYVVSEIGNTVVKMPENLKTVEADEFESFMNAERKKS